MPETIFYNHLSIRIPNNWRKCSYQFRKTILHDIKADHAYMNKSQNMFLYFSKDDQKHIEKQDLPERLKIYQERKQKNEKRYDQKICQMCMINDHNFGVLAYQSDVANNIAALNILIIGCIDNAELTIVLGAFLNNVKNAHNICQSIIRSINILP